MRPGIIQALVDLVKDFALRSNTVSSYTTQQKHLSRLLKQLGRDFSSPMSEETLSVISILYVYEGHKLSTLPIFLSACNNLSLARFGTAIPRNNLFKSVQKGLNNIFANELECAQAVGISMPLLLKVRSRLDLSLFVDSRFWCMAMFAFFGILRINEYANGGLRQENVAVCQSHMQLTIPYSKTQATATLIELCARVDGLCPVAAFRCYVELLGELRSKLQAPFFCVSPNSQAAYSDRAFIKELRSHLSHFVSNSSSFSGHSFRRGGFTAMIEHGVPTILAQIHGRWSSLSYERYLDAVNSSKSRGMATLLLSKHHV